MQHFAPTQMIIRIVWWVTTASSTGSTSAETYMQSMISSMCYTVIGDSKLKFLAQLVIKRISQKHKILILVPPHSWCVPIIKESFVTG